MGLLTLSKLQNRKIIMEHVVIDRDHRGESERVGFENLRSAFSELAAIKDAAIDSAKEFGHLKLENALTFARLSKEISESAAKSAECCCETRALIADKAHRTDDLIREIAEKRLATELADKKLELLILNAVLAGKSVAPITQAVIV